MPIVPSLTPWLMSMIMLLFVQKVNYMLRLWKCKYTYYVCWLGGKSKIESKIYFAWNFTLFFFRNLRLLYNLSCLFENPPTYCSDIIMFSSVLILYGVIFVFSMYIKKTIFSYLITAALLIFVFILVLCVFEGKLLRQCCFSA